MPSSPTPIRPFARALGWLALGLTACQSAGAERIVGPDGSQMSHVHCGSDQATCFRIAGELCPHGYEMKPVLSRNDGNFLVRCRMVPAQVASCPSVAPGAVSRSGSNANESWPPSNEPWPLLYPWPPPETAANVRATPAPGPALDE
jgi:hypothetical protein